MTRRNKKRFFSALWYVGHYYKKIGLKGIVRPFHHYLTVGWREGMDPSAKFSSEGYLFYNPDVAAVQACPLKHYVEHGEKEGRQSIPSILVLEKMAKKKGLFDEKYYLAQVKKKVEMPAFSHYLFYGWKKGYDPSPRFSTEKYLEKYDPVRTAKLNPLLHYLQYGLESGGYFDPVYVNTQEEGDYKKRRMMALPRGFWSLIYLRQKMERRKEKKKILVVVHVYYIRAWEEIKCYLDNLKGYDYDLVITADLKNFPSELKERINCYKDGIKFFDAKNAGFDVGPFVALVGETDLKKYDVVIKLQTKGTGFGSKYVYGRLFKGRDWFKSLFDGVIGPRNVHRTIAKLTRENGKIGLVGTRELIEKDREYLCTFVREVLGSLKIKVPKSYHYILGTCFGVKAELLEPMKKMGLKLSDFDISVRRHFSLAHAFERWFGITVEEQGYLVDGNPIIPIRRIKYRAVEGMLKEKDCLKILEQEKIKISPEATMRNLANRQMSEYKIIDVPISGIRVRWKNERRYKVTETGPYLYLKNGDKHKYHLYCLRHRETDFLVGSGEDFKNMPEEVFVERFEKIKKIIEKEGFDKTRPIILDGDGPFMCDGLHRTCIMAYLNGEDTKIRALVINYVVYGLGKAKPFSRKLPVLYGE